MTSSIAVPSEALRAQHRKGEVDERENREDESDDLVEHEPMIARAKRLRHPSAGRSCIRTDSPFG